MKKEIAQTALWLWGIARNPDLVWVDQKTKEEEREHCSRRFRYQVLRPIWMFTFLTTDPGCGCRRRLGIWQTIWCAEHLFGDSWKCDDEDDDE